jgi:osmoprotectant transport system permease protein
MSDPWVDWTWIADHGELFQRLIGLHVYLSVMPIVYGLALSLPLGLAAVRWPRIYPPLLAATSIVYALPAIALFIALLPITGLEPTTVIIPLTLYSLSILIRNVVDGLRSVPEHVRQAATAMGFSGLRRLLQVDLPIAVPIIISGLRVATVSSISLVSVGALIGVGGLGELFIDGFQRNFKTPLVAGVVLSILLAVTADTILVIAQRLLTPWARGRRRTA